MGYGKQKIRKKEELGRWEREREKRKKMEVQDSWGFIFIKLHVPYKLCTKSPNKNGLPNFEQMFRNLPNLNKFHYFGNESFKANKITTKNI